MIDRFRYKGKKKLDSILAEICWMNKVLYEKQKEEEEEQQETALQEEASEDNAEGELEDSDFDFYVGEENEYYDECADAVYEVNCSDDDDKDSYDDDDENNNNNRPTKSKKMRNC